jgi:hypothetical protein
VTSLRRGVVLPAAAPALAALCLSALPACGGDAGSAAVHTVSAADLSAVLAKPPPPRPSKDEAWHADTEDNARNPETLTIAELLADADPSQAGELRALKRAGLRRAYGSMWTRAAGDGNGVNAEGVAWLFADSTGAARGAQALRALAREQDDESSTPRVDDISALDVGSDGWGLHLSGGDEAYEYGFVLGNAVVVLDMLCWDGNCLPDQQVKESTAKYAQAIADGVG